MSFETLQQDGNQIERKRTSLQLKMEIQRSLIALRFSPNEEEKMLDWVVNNGRDFSDALDTMIAEHEDFEFLWEHAPDTVLEEIAERMNMKGKPDGEEVRYDQAA